MLTLVELRWTYTNTWRVKVYNSEHVVYSTYACPVRVSTNLDS
jgi:hypothetical protein